MAQKQNDSSKQLPADAVGSEETSSGISQSPDHNYTESPDSLNLHILEIYSVRISGEMSLEMCSFYKFPRGFLNTSEPRTRLFILFFACMF